MYPALSVTVFHNNYALSLVERAVKQELREGRYF